MTNYQSTVYTVEDETNETSAAFSTLPSPADADTAGVHEREPVLKLWHTTTLPDGQALNVSVLFTLDDVRGLQAYLNDQFGRGKGSHADVPPADLSDNPRSVQHPDNQYADAPPIANQNGDPMYGEQVSGWRTGATGASVWNPLEAQQAAELRQCPVIYNGIQCAKSEWHHDAQGEPDGHEFIQEWTSQPHPDDPRSELGNDGLTDEERAAGVAPMFERPEIIDTGAAFSPDDTADTAAKPESAPKKSGRRKKEEIAYDRALEAFRKQPNSQLEYTELTKAAEALRKRFPDAERLLAYDLHVQHQDIGYLSPEYKSEPSNGDRPPEAPQQAAQPGPQFAPEPTAQAQPAPFVPPATTQHPDGLPLPAPEQVSPEEAAAAQAFPCGHVSEMSQRPCIRPAGHELANPPKPHIYAPLEQGQSLPVPSFIPPMPATAPAQHGPGHSAAGFPIEQPNFTVTPVADGQGFSQQQIPPFQIPQPVGGPAAAGPQASAQVLSFQVPPTPAIEGAEIQPPAPAAPPWGN